MRFARVATVLSLIVATLLWAEVAAADSGATGSGGGSSAPSVGVSTPGTPGAGGGGGTVSCQYSDANPTVGTGSSEVFSPVPGKEYFLVCSDANGVVVFAAFVVYNPAAPIDPATLARQAWKQLPLVFPTTYTSPDRGSPQYTGLSTWMWISTADWQPRSATASVPGLSATVTATPSRVEWDMGDGRPLERCGQGTAYDTARPARDQSTDCSHTYTDASATRADGVFHAVATMWWTVSWQATDGSQGTLPDVFRTTTFDLRVDEIEALRQGGSP